MTDFQRMLLHTHLAMAVPLEIERLRGQDQTVLDALWDQLRHRIQEGADTLQFGGGQPGQIARNIGAWTRTFALLALQADGGVDYDGLHWCRDPHCRARSRYEHADIGPDDQLPELPPEPEPRPIVDIHLPAYEGEAA